MPLRQVPDCGDHWLPRVQRRERSNPRVAVPLSCAGYRAWRRDGSLGAELRKRTLVLNHDQGRSHEDPALRPAQQGALRARCKNRHRAHKHRLSQGFTVARQVNLFISGVFVYSMFLRQAVVII
jgi:hypothetical protein